MCDDERRQRSWRGPDLRLAVWVLALVLQGPALAQHAESGCGSIDNPYGPFDYRTDRHKLGIVETYHFKPWVEALVGRNIGIGGNLDYTLRAFPNHHRALLALTRFGEKLKSPQPPGTHFSIDCYFDRALRFRPDDQIVRMIFAGHLAKQGRDDAAVQQLELATAAAKDNAFSHYNIGLIYFDLKHYDKALRQAHKALALGFPRTDLKSRLEAAGKWVEP